MKDWYVEEDRMDGKPFLWRVKSDKPLTFSRIFFTKKEAIKECDKRNAPEPVYTKHRIYP